MVDEQKVVHFFVSSAATNYNGLFQFQFRETIQNIIGVRVKGVIIANFVNINLSYVYFLKTDLLSYTRDGSRFNTSPNQVAFSIPFDPSTAGIPVKPIYRFSDAEAAFRTNAPFGINGMYLGLLDVNGNSVNPPDVGWSFTVELEFIIKNYN